MWSKLRHYYTHVTLQKESGVGALLSYLTGFIMTDSFAELFEESLKEIEMKPGSIIDGIVV